MKGVILDLKSIDNGDLDLSCLQSVIPDWQYFDNTQEEEILSRIKDANVVIANKVRLGEVQIASSNALKLICIAATGTNNVDLEAAAANGVKVCNVTNYATPSVVQHVYCLLLALITKFKQYQTAIQEHRWQQSPFFCLLDYPIAELAGKKLGIIGYGVLGQAVAELGKAFGMHVLISARKGSDVSQGRVTLEQLLRQSDVVSLHCPLTPETHNLIGEQELKLMKPGALLINTARGGIVNEKALAEALVTGTIAGAGMDVLSEEPPKNGNPLLDLDLPNLIITPHIAWSSVESRQRLMEQVALNIDAFFNGKPRNIVNCIWLLSVRLAGLVPDWYAKPECCATVWIVAYANFTFMQFNKLF